MAALVDTNVLVYGVDFREPAKQSVAQTLLKEGAASHSVKLAHQVLVEFVAAVVRPRGAARPLSTPAEAWRSVEELLTTFEVLYPTADLVRLALRGAAMYQLSWYDAHLWAYAEHFGLDTLYSEDFQHGRRYGRVRVLNPFV